MKFRFILMALAGAFALSSCGNDMKFNKEFSASSVEEPDETEDEPGDPPQKIPAPPKNTPTPPPSKNSSTDPDCPYFTSCEACINALGAGDICLDKRRFFSAVAGKPVECYKHIDTNQYDWRNCRYDHVGYSGTNPSNGRKHFDPEQDCLWSREQPGVEYDYATGIISNPGGQCD